ncbi:PREDICTED: putative nuclease HARBI1 [Rhagoletis zephyria]|uniref:putative nuclease HARBI1 n=1 Tax=Rhagoletis zephyria TaxID=28612 RepID=UPI00081164D8|nr:PREDICTED: putative nuclease HARBI1 [Rhagoletis zephyria]
MECFRSIADRFGVSPKASWSAVTFVCKYLLKINRVLGIISWPTSEEAQNTASYFEEKTRFPGVIGCIDGSHIPIVKPKLYPNSYINRKKYHSILLQAICNERMEFIDCYAGEAGSIHDACLFRRSKVFRKISDGTISIQQDKHLLGDQGYALKSYLLIPFKDCGNLSSSQKKYNNVHSSIRVVIERAFGLLKVRFRRLQKLNTRRPDVIPLLIISCCILHNFCLKENDFLNEELPLSEMYPIVQTSNNTDTSGNEKRNAIVRIL